MLSFARMAAGHGKYYLNLSNEDYYLDGGEPPGRWWGGGAERLGLCGTVKKADLRRLLRGFSPQGKPLVQNAGQPRRHAGVDGCFSLNKMLAVLWAVSPTLRTVIQEIHDAGVLAALQYIQDTASFSRVGKGSVTRVPAGLVVALFNHGTSRALDPQPHTHCLFMNAVTRPDGSTGSLLTRPLFLHKMAAGAVYKAEVAAQAERRLGLRIERDKTSFTVVGVLQSVADFFSKRRAAIKAELAANGRESAKAAAVAALATRDFKELPPPRRELFARWEKEAAQLGFTQETVKTLIGTPPVRDPKSEFAAAFKDALKELSQTRSHFSSPEVLRYTAIAALGRGIDAACIRKGVAHELEHSKHLVRLTSSDGTTRYATAASFAVEKRFFSLVKGLRRNRSHGVSKAIIKDVLTRYAKPRAPVIEELKHHVTQLVRAARKQSTTRIDRKALLWEAALTLSAEQVAAVRYLTGRGRGIRLVSGMAGTGKTLMLKAAREAWERGGYKVIGFALAAKAARELEKASAIKSYTVARLFWELSNAFARRARHVAYRLRREAKLSLQMEIKGLTAKGKRKVRAAFRKYDRPFERLKFDKKTVVVLDEASMLGTKEFTRLLAVARKAGALVVCVGDPKQLQAIEAGGPFASLLKRHPHIELKNIARQHNPADIAAVHDFAQGQAAKALKNLADRGLLTVAKDRSDAAQHLVADWFKYQRKRPEASLIFCGTRAEAKDINSRCQMERRRAGDITGRPVQIGDEALYPGDRVLFTENSRALGICNGDLGTIVAIRSWPAAISVRLDKGGYAVIPLASYQNIKLGYAVTTHKGQGTTVENSYILAGGSMQDREMSYVQASRARNKTRVYTDQHEAGPNLGHLATQMTKSRTKDLAHDVGLTLQLKQGR